jgi:hypothetical protein
MSAPRYQLAACAADQHPRGWGDRPSVELEAIPAHLPVARLGLPAAVAPPVSSGPSKGERAWRSRRRHGTNAPPADRPNQRQVEVAE